MADYKLSYTAEEVDDLLKKVAGGVFLPVVELTTVLESDVQLTQEECAKLDAAVGSPCVIKGSLMGQGLCAPFAYAKDGGDGHMFVYALGGININIFGGAPGIPWSVGVTLPE